RPGSGETRVPVQTQRPWRSGRSQVRPQRSVGTWPLPSAGLAGLRAKLRLLISQLEVRRQNSSWAPKRDKDAPFSFLGVPYTRIEAALETSVQSRQPSRGDPWQTRNGPSRDANSSTATAPTAAPVNSTDCRRTDIARRWAGSRSSAAITDRPHSMV